MMVVIPTDSCCELTTPSMICMPSLTYILLANVVVNIDCAFSLMCKRLDNRMLINRQLTRLGVSNVHVAHRTLSRARTNHHVSQFGH